MLAAAAFVHSDAFVDSPNTTASALVKTDAFTKLYGQVSDSIVAARIDRSPSPKVRALLSATIRVLWLIRRLATTTPLTLTAYLTAPLVLAAAAARQLTEPTRNVLAASGFAGDTVDIVRAVTTLEGQATAQPKKP